MTNKDAMLEFFRSYDSQSLRDLIHFFLPAITQEYGEVEGAQLESLAIGFFESKCERNEDLLTWLTQEDAQTVFDLYAPCRCRN